VAAAVFFSVNEFETFVADVPSRKSSAAPLELAAALNSEDETASLVFNSLFLIKISPAVSNKRAFVLGVCSEIYVVNLSVWKVTNLPEALIPSFFTKPASEMMFDIFTSSSNTPDAFSTNASAFVTKSLVSETIVSNPDNSVVGLSDSSCILSNSLVKESNANNTESNNFSADILSVILAASKLA